MGNYCNLFFLKKSLFFSSGYWASNICLLQSKLLFYQKWLPFPIVLKRNEATHLLFLARLCCHCCWQEPVPSFWCFKRTTCSLSACSLSALRRKSSQSENEQFKTTLFGGGGWGGRCSGGGAQRGLSSVSFSSHSHRELEKQTNNSNNNKTTQSFRPKYCFSLGAGRGKEQIYSLWKENTDCVNMLFYI